MSRAASLAAFLAAAALLGLAAAGPAPAAPAGPLDIADGTPPRCAKADDRVLCLSDLSIRSAARVRAALGKARAALAASRTIADGDRAAALDTLARTQKAWRAYVRLRCKGEVPVTFTGGTGRNPAVLTCLRVHDERRTAELLDIAGMS